MDVKELQERRMPGWLKKLFTGTPTVRTPRRPALPSSTPATRDVIDVEVRDLGPTQRPQVQGTTPPARNSGSQGNATPRNINPIVGGTALTGLAGAGIYQGLSNNNRPPAGSNNPPGAGTTDPSGGGEADKPQTQPATTPGTPGAAATTPSQTAGTPGGAPASAARPTRGGGLAAALRDTQNAITAERKRKEGANYSGPSTVKKPSKMQSNIGTDFSDVAEGLMNHLLETPKGELHLSPEAKVVKRNLRDGDDATPAATARRQFRSAALRGVKKPKPIKKPRQETRMPGEQLNDMHEGHPEPKVNYIKDMDPYDRRRAPRDHAPGSPLPPASLTPGLPPMKLAKSKVKKPGNVKKA